MAIAVGFGLIGAGCGAPVQSARSLTGDGGMPATVADGSTGDVEPAVIVVDLPFVPPVVVPDLSVLDEAGTVVADRLGDLVTPVSGVDLVAVGCDDDDGRLVYQGTTGTDVFDIAADGSGDYYDERGGGVVSLSVDPDGSGAFYDDSRGTVVSIAAAADGSGEYYREESDGLVTVRVRPDGTGEYYDDRGDALLTIALDGSGAGRYYREGPDELLTVDVTADGSAQFYRTNPIEGLATIDLGDDGAWRYTATTSSRHLELSVAPDGSGTYAESGLRSLDVAFDAGGSTVDGHRIVVPPTPVFAVSGRFPALGRLGSLAPPCATVIRFDSALLFDFDSAELRPDLDHVLAEVVTALNETGEPIEIDGHSDSIGSADYNRQLSLQRAEAVERALRDRGLTVPAEVNGYGEDRPVGPNETPTGEDDPAGRALNRRVEIVIGHG